MSAGPDTLGPAATTTTGTTPEQRASSRAAAAQPSSAATPSDMSAPDEASRSTIGRRCWRAWRAASARLCPSEGIRAPERSSPPRASTSITDRPPISAVRTRTNPAAPALI